MAAKPGLAIQTAPGVEPPTLRFRTSGGSGYLTSLGISNSDNSISWPAGSSYVPANFSVENAHVFCNLGADWFTETRKVTAVDFSERTLSFAGRQNGVASCKDKAYLHEQMMTTFDTLG